MMRLSERTEKIIKVLFEEELQDEVRNAFFEKLFIPLRKIEVSERICFAALKYSKGELDRLFIALEEGSKDYRDLLVAAYFASDLNAHEKWADSILNKDLLSH